MTTKHTIDSFFVPASRKKARMEEAISKPTSGPIGEVTQTSRHLTYPFPIPHLSPHITDQLAQVPASTGKEVSDQADLDLLYFQPYIPKSVERDLFLFSDASSSSTECNTRSSAAASRQTLIHLVTPRSSASINRPRSPPLVIWSTVEPPNVFQETDEELALPAPSHNV